MIILETIEAPVQGEIGKVYSTGPEVAIGADRNTYYIKGRNCPTAFSEVAGCRLAALTGLKVPVAHVGTFAGDLYAAVKSVPSAQRNIRPWLQDLNRINNPLHLFEVVALDTWLVNDDRNMGNIVGAATGNGRVDAYMIDFEKSRTLTENPFMASGAVEPRHLWPTAELGSLLRQIRPPLCPANIIDTIRKISLQMIRDAISPIAADLPFVTWHESSIELLARRAKIIDMLVEAVWAAN